MNNEPIKKRKKRIQKVQVGQKVPGTDVIAMPYWDHIFATQDTTGEGVQVAEDAYANPDVVDAENAVNNRRLTAEGELQMEAINQTWDTLTERQKSILRLAYSGVWDDDAGECVYTEEAIASAIGVSQQTVSRFFSRIRTKIRRRYEKLKAERR